MNPSMMKTDFCPCRHQIRPAEHVLSENNLKITEYF
jgi:hypothetical protein